MDVPEVALCDTSVILRFFRDHKDPEQAGANRLRRAWQEDQTDLYILDLAVYEFINVTTRRFGWNAQRAGRSVGHLFDLDLGIVHCDRALAIAAAQTSADSRLSGYDAAFVAAARLNALKLITSDRSITNAAPDVAMPLASLTG